METINTEEKELGLEGILNELKNTIFSKEDWLDNNFYKIPEITYSYQNLWGDNIINLSLFSDLWDLDILDFDNTDIEGKWELIKSASEKIKQKINDKIKNIDTYIIKLNNIESDDEALIAKKNIILWWLKENIIFLQLAIEWLPFEEEKALIWIYHKWTTEEVEKKEKSSFFIPEEDRKSKLVKINELNTKLFWEKISENKEYIEWCIDYLHEQYENYKILEKNNKLEEKNILNEDEKNRYNWYIEKLQKLSPKYKAKIREKPKSIIDEETRTKKIDIKDFKNILNHSSVAYDTQTWNMPHRANFDPNISWITDTTQWTLIPNNEKFKEKSLFELFRLNIHENEQHWTAQVSHEALIWHIRWAKNLEAVEWMAVLAEDLFEFGENLFKESEDIEGNTVKIIDIEKLSYVQNFPKTMMEEILTDEEFYDFLELHNKIEPDKMLPIDRYLRHKRTWFQKKDTSYTIWKIKAAKYYNDIITGEIKWDFTDLYLWKVWFDDLDNIKLIKKDIENKNKDKEDSKKIKLPENLFFTEALYFSLYVKPKNKNLSFYNYLQIKYPYLKITEEKINSIKHSFKKQLLWAIKSIEEWTKNHKIKKEIIKNLNQEDKPFHNKVFLELIEEEMRKTREKSEEILHLK